MLGNYIPPRTLEMGIGKADKEIDMRCCSDSLRRNKTRKILLRERRENMKVVRF